MARKGKQVLRKRKAQMPEEDEKQNELILEEVLSISGKSVEKADGSPPARLKRSASKSNDIATTQPKKLNAKKRSLSPSSLPSKQKKSTDKEEDGEVTNSVDEVKASTLERGDPVPNLPDGWRRQVVTRKSGKSAGQMDIYFYSPDGIKLRSRPDVASYLKKHKTDLKIEEFDFSRAAKTAESVKKKATPENNTVPKKKGKTVNDEKSKVGVESKELSKDMSKPSEKVSEVPPDPDTEEKNDTTGKSNKALPEEKNYVDINGEKKNSRSCISTIQKRKAQLPEDLPEKRKVVSNKKLEKADEPSSARLKRSANKLNEIKSTQSKKLKTSPKNSTDEDVEANTVVNEVKTSERGVPVPNLPDGWRREVVPRKSGERAGQTDIYFYSPDGIKLRSRPDVASYLKKHKSGLKIEEFDFSRAAKTTEAVKKKATAAENSVVPQKKSKTDQEEKSRDGIHSSKNISTKESKSLEKLSAEVPQEKNDTEKSSQILRKMLESKSKKLRK